MINFIVLPTIGELLCEVLDVQEWKGARPVKDSQCAAGGRWRSIHNAAPSVRGPRQDRVPEQCMGVWIGGLLSIHWKSIRWTTGLRQIGRGIASERSGVTDWGGTSLSLCLGGLSLEHLTKGRESCVVQPHYGPCVQVLIKAGHRHDVEAVSGIQCCYSGGAKACPLPLTRLEMAKWNPWKKKSPQNLLKPTMHHEWL